MRDEVASLKQELAGDRKAADEHLLKKLKLEKTPSFIQEENAREAVSL